ncbi:putative oxidoreductase C-terminal domain-containing protein [Proteiniphilum sp.]|uniref:putative oxidoreductase C-terminal domain-containing protein n=1 Tax=Proteiniphilum sp. TaxID=1926877 RepID=UPI002B2166BC|nr:putative oxidoreductase C-terminal domain-containing protein [Proteiniphilum sp.]MEA4917888.1 putative oxidoreductase C-terminal domain-containing protein [Proteiniphilum sp.]
MKNILFQISVILGSLLLFSCNMNKETEKQQFTGQDGEVKLVVLDPGHFHASLLQKFPQRRVNDTVYVYAPEGDELQQYLASIESYNQREENPTNWHIELYAGQDYLEKMIEEKNGNVVILAGNNRKKTEYIFQSLNAGFNVLADKPMAINEKNFNLLKSAYECARTHDAYLLDVMTERNDMINTLTRELIHKEELFGELRSGSSDDPAITMESVHHYYKEVSGNTLVRPAWFYDVEQQGEGMADVSVHLVDLINWQCFPNEVIDHTSDVKLMAANHWPTRLTLDDFTRSTKLNAFPDFLQKYVNNDTLEVFGNGKIDYQVKGKNISVTVLWNYQAPEGGGDTYNGRIKGTKATIEIVQDASVNYIKELFIQKDESLDENTFNANMTKSITDLQKSYSFLSAEKVSEGRYKIIAPVEFRKGHEDYFGMVAERYFGYLVNRDMPEWEVSNTLSKYFITTTALEMARKGL